MKSFSNRRRKAAIDLSDWNTTTPDTTRTYLANGLLESIDNGLSKSEYSYDSCNQVTSETQTLTGQPARTVAYGYDADYLRLGMVQPSSRIVELAWTQRAQLAAVTADGPPPFATYTYDKAGRPKTLSHENGIVETKTYNAAGELLSNLHTLGGSTLSGHSYTYDTTSRRTAESFADGTTPARNYGYDLASQVISATYGGGLADAYAYDPAGNRQTATLASQGGTSLTYTANNVNQYTTITAQPAPVYDANGNLTQQNGNTYTWDSENRLLAVVPNTPATGAQALQYRYDAHHRRVTRTIQEWTGTAWASTATTHFIYDGWNVIEEYSLTSSTSTLAKTYTWGLDLSGFLQGAGGVGALLMAEEVGGSTTTAYHFHYDGNGNVTEITNAAGASAASYRYDAFGNTLTAAGSYAATNRYRFSTKPLDAEVINAPLYYYGYRWYDPLTGRWPSRDPLEEEGGINLYGFVGNNATTTIDMLGLEPYYVAASELLAVSHAGDEAKRKGEEWDAQNQSLVDPVNRRSIEEFGFGFAGMEYCGKICRKYTGVENGEDAYSFSYTIHRGTLPIDVFNRNLEIKRASEESRKIIEQHNRNLGPDGIPKALPEPEYVGASCQPLNAPSCSTLGEGWVLYSYYHSHPSNNEASQGDKDFANRTNRVLWLTRGERGRPHTWVIEAIWPGNQVMQKERPQQ